MFPARPCRLNQELEEDGMIKEVSYRGLTSRSTYPHAKSPVPQLRPKVLLSVQVRDVMHWISHAVVKQIVYFRRVIIKV